MTLSAMRARVSQRLNESAAPVFYPALEVTAALNEAQRTFALLTLGLEKTATWTLYGGTFVHMLTVFPDWLAPLRITDGAGAKIRHATLAELASLDPGWISSAGAPQRYVSLGGDFIGIYPQLSGYLIVNYARAPVALAGDTDVPEIPVEYHGALVEYAVYRCRMVEGGSEFRKSLKYFARFLEAAKHYAAYIRRRNNAAKYDGRRPFDLDHHDLTPLIGAQ